MNANSSNGVINVQLSRRNLQHLLRLLDMRVALTTLNRELEDGTILHVKAEENNEHYGSREPGPGANEIEMFWHDIGRPKAA